MEAGLIGRHYVLDVSLRRSQRDLNRGATRSWSRFRHFSAMRIDGLNLCWYPSSATDTVSPVQAILKRGVSCLKGQQVAMWDL